MFGGQSLSSYIAQHNLDKNIIGKIKSEIVDEIVKEICNSRITWKCIEKDNVLIKEVEDVSEFLEGVMVHPTAPKWYVDIIYDICKSRDIPFDGQSDIYTLK